MRLGYLKFLFLLALGTSTASLLAAQSLADIARKEQAKKGAPKSSKVITNDDLDNLKKTPGQITTASGNSSATPKDEKSSDSADDSKNDGAKDNAQKTDSAEDKQTLEATWKAKFSDQKSKIDLLQREIDVMEREQRLRTTMYYTDAGNKLRDSKQFTQQQQKLNDDLDKKKKELDEAKTELEKMKEDARKLGLRIS